MGTQAIGTRDAPDRCRRASLISTGPVAQLSPTTSTCMASSTVNAAPISVPGQHPAGQLDRHLRLQRHDAVERRHGPAGAVDGGLDRQHVELRLDEQQVDAALEQPERLLLVGVAEVGVARSGRAWGTSSPAPWSRPPSAGGRVWRTRCAPRRRARPPCGSARGPGRPGRTRPARPRSTRTCRSRRRRTPPRRTSGAPAPPARASSRRGPRCSPRARGPPKSSGLQPEELEVRAHGAVEDDHALAQRLEVGGRGRVETSQQFGGGCHEGIQDTGAPVAPGTAPLASAPGAAEDLHQDGRRRDDRAALRRAGPQGLAADRAQRRRRRGPGGPRAGPRRDGPRLRGARAADCARPRSLRPDGRGGHRPGEPQQAQGGVELGHAGHGGRARGGHRRPARSASTCRATSPSRARTGWPPPSTSPARSCAAPSASPWPSRPATRWFPCT